MNREEGIIEDQTIKMARAEYQLNQNSGHNLWSSCSLENFVSILKIKPVILNKF
ncbi:hypothetical protein Hanom_Chr12g01118381 [Helianthus anomalus]